MTLPAIHEWLRLTARLSGFVFLMAFAAPAFVTVWDSVFTRLLNVFRHRFFLGFAALHTVHLGFVIYLAIAMGPAFFKMFPKAGLVGGIIVYGLIYTVAACSLRNAEAPPLFRSVVFYLLWTIFAMAFTVSAISHPALPPLAVAAYVAFVIRLAGAIRSRRLVTAVRRATA